MREDTALRFHLANRLLRLRYGDTMAIQADMVESAWPPTGDADPSMEAGLLAMAIAARGGTPISSYTTEERIIRDLDETFAPPVYLPHERVYRIHRKMSDCPHCHGSGWIRVHTELAMPDLAAHSAFSVETAAITTKTVKCDHRP